MVDSSDLEGTIEMTERWRSVVPDFSVELASDLTDVANDHRRVELVRQRYALELEAPRGTQPVRGVVADSRLDWVPATAQERQTPRQGVPFALCRGIPSVLAEVDPDRALDGLDYAILVPVGRPLLPVGRCCWTGCRSSSVALAGTGRSRATLTSSGRPSFPSRRDR